MGSGKHSPLGGSGWACEGSRGRRQYPLSHTRVDCLAPSVLIALAMPGDLSCLLSIGPKHNPGVVLRQGQVDIPETQGLAGPHHRKGHTGAVQFGAYGAGGNERGFSELWPGGRGLGRDWPCSLPPSPPSRCPNLRPSSITPLSPSSYCSKPLPPRLHRPATDLLGSSQFHPALDPVTSLSLKPRYMFRLKNFLVLLCLPGDNRIGKNRTKRLSPLFSHTHWQLLIYLYTLFLLSSEAASDSFSIWHSRTGLLVNWA